MSDLCLILLAEQTKRSLLWSGKYLNPVAEFNQQQGFGFRISPQKKKEKKESWLGSREGGGNKMPKDIIKLMDYRWLKALHCWVSQTADDKRHAERRCREPRAESLEPGAGSGVTSGISSPASSSLQLVLAGTERSVNTYYSARKSSDRRRQENWGQERRELSQLWILSTWL